MWNLPQDIMVDILSALPAKSLLRMRFVCKLWLTLINDPCFVKMHINRAIEKNKHSLLLRSSNNFYSVDLNASSSSYKAVQIDCPFEIESRKYGTEVLGSCNGLICISTRHDVIYLWNPCTKECKRLPSPTVDLPKVWWLWSAIIYGFGYDPIADDYKLVRIVFFVSGNHVTFSDPEVQIYELGTNSWRRIRNIPYNFCLSYTRSIGVHVNETPHWIMNPHNGSDLSRSSLIVTFDFGSEDFGEVPLPDYVLDDESHKKVGVLGGCLCIFSYLNDGAHINIWVMKDYGVKDSWVKLFTITDMPHYFLRPIWRPLCFSKNGEILLENGKDLVLYDPKSERIEKLKISCPPNFFPAHMHMESLVSLK